MASSDMAAALQELYVTSNNARSVLDYCAERTNKSAVTKLDRLAAVLTTMGRSDIIWVLKKLEKIGYGRFIVGRRGQPTRFEWGPDLRHVGRTAAGLDAKVVIEDAVDTERHDGASDLLTHVFNLRRDIRVEILLPADLTISEAARLAKFVQTLPIDM